ncbi:MAG: manganese efflux pump, partial [Prochlorococcaceae cyanobacterium]
MTLIDLLILGIVIGANNLAVALALGAMGQVERRWRVLVVFGVFEFTMPLLGIGLGLLTVVAGVRNRRQDEKLARSATSWRGLTVLAFGLSLDNVVVGFSLGLGGSNPLAVATTIAWFSVLFTWIGMGLGRTSRRHWERVA